jgi:hypothetical protein
MQRPERDTGEIDALYQRLLLAGESRTRARAVLAEAGEDEALLAAVLRRAVPVAFLEELAAAPAFRDRPRLLARVVLHPRTPRELGLRLVGSLGWRDLADVAATARVSAAVRYRAESLLRDSLDEMRLGDRVCLGRLATPALLPALLADGEPLVVEAVLRNPRVREEDLVVALRSETASRTLLETAAEAPRWQSSYAVRLALAAQPRTPIAVGLLQLRRLLPRDLRTLARDSRLPVLLRLAAERVLEAGGSQKS